VPLALCLEPFVYASLLKIAPDGFERGARLASGAFYLAVLLMTFYEIIKLGISKDLLVWASEVLKTGNRKETARREISLQNNKLGRHE
jgi:hypothetical protein